MMAKFLQWFKIFLKRKPFPVTIIAPSAKVDFYSILAFR